MQRIHYLTLAYHKKWSPISYCFISNFTAFSYESLYHNRIRFDIHFILHVSCLLIKNRHVFQGVVMLDKGHQCHIDSFNCFVKLLERIRTVNIALSTTTCIYRNVQFADILIS